jgi:carbon monoxide dehydrogenase subunit G
MPTVTRSGTVDAPQEAVWEVVSDPYHLPRWWPGVTRVEDVGEDTWTNVLESPRGRAVRADYTRVYLDAPNRVVWRQELEQTPFERFLRESVTGVILAAEGDATHIEVRFVQKLKGMARFGGFMARRAAAKQLDEAIENLRRVVVA